MKNKNTFVMLALLLCSLSLGAQVNIPKDWYESARKGDNSMMNLIGSEYENHKMIDSAIYWHTKAAQLGNMFSQSTLGQLYERMSPPDYENSFRWYNAAAEQGYGWAQFKVGHFYHYGMGVEENHEQAEKWLKSAAEIGYCYGLPQYEYGKYFAPKETTKHWLLESYKAGYDEALNEIGELYLTGWLGLEPDSAFKYYQLAAQKGNANAYYNLSECYAHGQGCKQSYKEAIWYYRMAESKQSGSLDIDKMVNSNNNSAYEFDMNSGQLKMKDDACYYWYREVAYRNDPVCKCRIMACYLNGLYGVEKNDEETLYWCEEAANEGVFEARMLLAKSYEEVNYTTQAIFWYQCALNSDKHMEPETTDGDLERYKQQCHEALKRLGAE